MDEELHDGASLHFEGVREQRHATAEHRGLQRAIELYTVAYRTGSERAIIGMTTQRAETFNKGNATA